jgi:hypothetical protein
MMMRIAKMLPEQSAERALVRAARRAAEENRMNEAIWLPRRAEGPPQETVNQLAEG